MGALLRVHACPPALMSAIDAGLGRYPDDLALQLTLDLVVKLHDEEPGDPAWPQVTATDDADTLEVRCGSAVLTLHHDSATAVLQLPASLLEVADALRLFVESCFTALAVRRGQLLAVHSALVADRGVGLLLRGPSGAGKSTLTYSCLRRGMAMCSDDWVYAPALGDVGRFAGYPWRMLMTEDAAARFPELDGAPTVPHPAAEGRKVPIVPPFEQQLATCIASAVVLLDPAPELSLRRIDSDEARERFWAPALPTERDHLPERWVAALLDRPVYVLHRGAEPAAAAQALADLVDSLR